MLRDNVKIYIEIESSLFINYYEEIKIFSYFKKENIFNIGFD